MRITAFTLLSMMFSTAAFAEYSPFEFKCSYDATTDGIITVTTAIDPDVNDVILFLKSDLKNEAEEAEGEYAYVYRPDEIPEENRKPIQELSKLLKINLNEVFTFTEVKVGFQPDAFMTFYKFNSQDGELGVGIHTSFQGQSYYQRCASVK